MNGDAQNLLDFYLRQREARPKAFTHQTHVLNPQSLFSLKQMQAHLNNPALGPNWFQIIEKGQIVDLKPYSFGKMVQGKALPFIDKTVVNDAIDRGAALVLEGLDIIDPQIHTLITEIDRAMPCALSNCAAFFSQNNNEAYYGHCDTDDVLVVQVQGKKTWHIYEPQQRRYLGISPLSEEQMGPKLAEITLEPGDALYVAAGTPHRCVTPEKFSLHISFDLIDKTPNVEHITREANVRYNYSSADPYAEPSQVVARYAEMINSQQFLSDLARATEQTRRNTLEFRSRIGRAASVEAFDRIQKQDGVN